MITIGVDPGASSWACTIVDWGARRLLWGLAQHEGGDPMVCYGERWRTIGLRAPMSIAFLVGDCFREHGPGSGVVEGVAFFARGKNQSGRVGGNQLVELAASGGWWAGVLAAAGVEVRRPLASEWRATVLGLKRGTPAHDAEQCAVDCCDRLGMPLPRGPRGGLAGAGHVAEAIMMSHPGRLVLGASRRL